MSELDITSRELPVGQNLSKRTLLTGLEILSHPHRSRSRRPDVRGGDVESDSRRYGLQRDCCPSGKYLAEDPGTI